MMAIFLLALGLASHTLSDLLPSPFGLVSAVLAVVLFVLAAVVSFPR